MMMAGCCKEFEKLPVIENAEILRNILYSGVWYRYEAVRAKRENAVNEQKKSDFDRRDNAGKRQMRKKSEEGWKEHA